MRAWRLGHEDVTTTPIYTHVMRKGASAVRCPLDAQPRTRRDRSGGPGAADVGVRASGPASAA